MSSIVPPKVELVATLDIAKALRKIMRDVSPPTLMATKLPGLHSLALSPILTINWWYWPTRLLLIKTACIDVAFLLMVAIFTLTILEVI